MILEPNALYRIESKRNPDFFNIVLYLSRKEDGNSPPTYMFFSLEVMDIYDVDCEFIDQDKFARLWDIVKLVDE